MAGVSKLNRLSREVYTGMVDRFVSGETVTDVTLWLTCQGIDISRSSVGRARLGWARSVARLQEVNDFARYAVRGLADDPESLTAKANVNMITGMLFTVASALEEKYAGDPDKLLDALTKVARAQAHLARASKNDAEKTIMATDFADSYEPDVPGGDEDALTVAFVNAPRREDGAGKNADPEAEPKTAQHEADGDGSSNGQKAP